MAIQKLGVVEINCPAAILDWIRPGVMKSYVDVKSTVLVSSNGVTNIQMSADVIKQTLSTQICLITAEYQVVWSFGSDEV